MSRRAHTDIAQEAHGAKWGEKNHEALEAHNRFIEKHGIWSRKYRSW